MQMSGSTFCGGRLSHLIYDPWTIIALLTVSYHRLLRMKTQEKRWLRGQIDFKGAYHEWDMQMRGPLWGHDC